jgi:hypothetical protein
MEKLLNHPILGRLKFDTDLDWWSVNIQLNEDCWIDFLISVEETDLEHRLVVDRSVEYLEWARSHESQCRDYITDALLDIYNEHWAEDDGIGQLERAEFRSTIAPASLILYPDGRGIWYYHDGDLFAGHTIEIGIDPNRRYDEINLPG